MSRCRAEAIAVASFDLASRDARRMEQPAADVGGQRSTAVADLACAVQRLLASIEDATVRRHLLVTTGLTCPPPPNPLLASATDENAEEKTAQSSPSTGCWGVTPLDPLGKGSSENLKKLLVDCVTAVGGAFDSVVSVFSALIAAEQVPLQLWSQSRAAAVAANVKSCVHLSSVLDAVAAANRRRRLLSQWTMATVVRRVRRQDDETFHRARKQWMQETRVVVDTLTEARLGPERQLLEVRQQHETLSKTSEAQITSLRSRNESLERALDKLETELSVTELARITTESKLQRFALREQRTYHSWASFLRRCGVSCGGPPCASSQPELLATATPRDVNSRWRPHSFDGVLQSWRTVVRRDRRHSGQRRSSSLQDDLPLVPDEEEEDVDGSRSSCRLWEAVFAPVTASLDADPTAANDGGDDSLGPERRKRNALASPGRGSHSLDDPHFDSPRNLHTGAMDEPTISKPPPVARVVGGCFSLRGFITVYFLRWLSSSARARWCSNHTHRRHISALQSELTLLKDRLAMSTDTLSLITSTNANQVGSRQFLLSPSSPLAGRLAGRSRSVTSTGNHHSSAAIPSNNMANNMVLSPRSAFASGHNSTVPLPQGRHGANLTPWQQKVLRRVTSENDATATSSQHSDAGTGDAPRPRSSNTAMASAPATTFQGGGDAPRASAASVQRSVSIDRLNLSPREWSPADGGGDAAKSSQLAPRSNGSNLSDAIRHVASVFAPTAQIASHVMARGGGVNSTRSASQATAASSSSATPPLTDHDRMNRRVSSQRPSPPPRPVATNAMVGTRRNATTAAVVQPLPPFLFARRGATGDESERGEGEGAPPPEGSGRHQTHHLTSGRRNVTVVTPRTLQRHMEEVQRAQQAHADSGWATTAPEWDTDPSTLSTSPKAADQLAIDALIRRADAMAIQLERFEPAVLTPPGGGSSRSHRWQAHPASRHDHPERTDDCSREAPAGSMQPPIDLYDRTAWDASATS